jgi:hypothetical protein
MSRFPRGYWSVHRSVNIVPPVRRKSEILGILERMRSSPLDRVVP